MIQKFVPGKWEYNRRFQYPHEFYEIHCRDSYIAGCPYEGNARLIACAPELFNLLEEILFDEESQISPEFKTKAEFLLKRVLRGKDRES